MAYHSESAAKYDSDHGSTQRCHSTVGAYADVQSMAVPRPETILQAVSGAQISIVAVNAV